MKTTTFLLVLLIQFLSLSVSFAETLELIDGGKIEAISLSFNSKGALLLQSGATEPKTVFWSKISRNQLNQFQKKLQLDFVREYLVEAREKASLNPERSKAILSGLTPLVDQMSAEEKVAIKWAETLEIELKTPAVADKGELLSHRSEDLKRSANNVVAAIKGKLGGRLPELRVIGIIVVVVLVLLVGLLLLVRKFRNGELAGGSVMGLIVGICCYVAARGAVTHFTSGDNSVPREVRNNPAFGEMMDTLKADFSDVNEATQTTEQLLKITEQSMRKNLPIRIDAQTKLIDVNTGPGKLITYEYEVSFIDARDEVKEQIKAHLQKSYDRNMKAFKKRGVSARYRYYNKQGDLILEHRISP